MMMDEGRQPPRPPPKIMSKPRPGFSTLRPTKSRSQPTDMPQVLDDSTFTRPSHKPPPPPSSPSMSPSSLPPIPAYNPSTSNTASPSQNNSTSPIPPPKRPPPREGVATLRPRKAAPPLDLNAIISNADTNFTSRSTPQSPTFGVPKKQLPVVPVPTQRSDRPESPSNSPRKAPAIPTSIRPTVTRTNSANFVLRRNGDHLTDSPLPQSPPSRPQRMKPLPETIESPPPTRIETLPTPTNDESPSEEIQQYGSNPLSFSAPIHTRPKREVLSEPTTPEPGGTPSRPVFVIPQTLFAAPPVNPYIKNLHQPPSPESIPSAAEPLEQPPTVDAPVQPPVPSVPKPPARQQKRASAPSSSGGEISKDPRRPKPSGSGEKSIKTYSLASTSSSASFDGEYLGIPGERPNRAPRGLGTEKIDLEALGAQCGTLNFKPTEWVSPYGSYDNFLRSIREENLRSGLFARLDGRATLRRSMAVNLQPSEFLN